MATSSPVHLSPRKKPRQARATATLDAIFEATIQVLLVTGPHGLTTTRVAERAGVSVGTMYQYYPHKQALLFALNERYLDVLAEKVEAACRVHHGTTIGEMLDALVTTYWKAKTERADVTRVLYRAAAELDTETLIEAFARRVDTATFAMFGSASDVTFSDLDGVNLMLLTTIFGTVRNVFERNLPPPVGDSVYRQLILMCNSYVEAVRVPSILSEERSATTEARDPLKFFSDWRSPDSMEPRGAVAISDRIWLSKAQMRQIEAFFPLSHGMQRGDDRRIISGILFVLRNCLRWCDAPAEYGPPKTLYNRFTRWSQLGVFNKIFATLSEIGAKAGQPMIDVTHLKAHRTAASLLKKGLFPDVSNKPKGA